MPTCRTRLALLLLLCLVRTLLPGTWILALHSHAHTTEEPARALAVARKGTPLLSPQHQHCDVEQFYHAAFQPALPVALPSFRLLQQYAPLASTLAERAAAGRVVRTRALRGPPEHV